MLQRKLFVVAYKMRSDTHEVWFIGSGASRHIIGKLEWCYEVWKGNQKVTIGDDTNLEAVGVQNIPFITPNGERQYLENVLHVPNLKANLVSIGELNSKT